MNRMNFKWNSHRPQLKLERRIVKFEALLLALVLVFALAATRTQADSSNCSGQTINLPFTDVMGSFAFCFIAQIYFQGITSGTSATTYSPNNNVTREQMAVFLSRTQNSLLNRGSQRAAANQFATTVPNYTVPQGAAWLGTTDVASYPLGVASDGADLWVTSFFGHTVSRVRASDGKLLETWTGVTRPFAVVAAMGRVFVTSWAGATRLYVLDPRQPAGAVTLLSTALGSLPIAIAFDGQRLWTANNGAGSVSIITPGTPFTVTNSDGLHFWIALNAPARLARF